VPASAPNPVYDAVAPYLTANSAKARALPTPQAGGSRTEPPGRSRSARRPAWVVRVWTALGVGVLGAIALIVLAVVE